MNFTNQPKSVNIKTNIDAITNIQAKLLIDGHASGDPSAYPKVAMWNSHGEGEGSDCCPWDGVECDRETGHVIGLHLASSCLYGSINSSNTLFSLVHLRRLDLSNNHFNDSEIPFGVGQLLRLRSLNLSDSAFAGQIPSELLALSNLVFLDLSANPMLQLQKPSLRNLVQNVAHLKKLRLSEVNISSTIPHELANLSSLTTLFLRECGLHGEFPMNIFQLPSLKILNVSYNPDLIGYLPEFQETSPLKELHLYGTSFSGELPTSIGRFGSLTELDICSCNFTGLVPSPLGHLPQLSILMLDSNMLQGPLPILPPSTIEYYSVSRNKLIGEFSPLICNMSSLMLLDLSSNNLSGRIPQCLANLSKSLSILDLGSNSLDGPIPQTCTVPNNFKVIDLGDLPSENFQNWDAMKLTDIANDLRYMQARPEFQVPGYEWIARYMYSMTMTNRGMQRFYEKIPDIFIAIDFSGNNFKGQIPTSIGNLKGLHLLNLGDNNLTGHITSSLGNIPQLESLDLS
ncbi:Receptor-like protein 12 [Vitis vinifera]|uniref:Receptor-like protein 12 n=1 Tax=Vitis vinifera TaxID=29760 RepID=A0A438G6S4_VITVI|nr:Receptor-like protein 12 [Vitis vinifera]